MTQADKWSDYWVNEGSSGEVFVSGDGDKHPYLASYWQTQFSGLAPTSSIIDLASGAGSIFSHLPEDHSYQLCGADLSMDALQLLRRRLPATRVVTCSVAQLPFPNRHFDLVVSQFGIEYAGLDAFTEAANLVAGKGRFVILCHHEDGYIDKKNKGYLAGAEKVVETGFIDKAIDMVEAIFSGQKERFRTAQSTFIPAERQVSSMAKRHEGGVHSHLYTGFRQLFERRQHYDAVDITSWLEAMRLDVDKNIVRLNQMCHAACSEDQIKQVCRQISRLGLSKVGYSPFTIPDTKLPVAWSITAQRP